MCLLVASMTGYEVLEIARSGAKHPRELTTLTIASGGDGGDGDGGEAGVGAMLLDYIEEEADSLRLETRLCMRASQGEGLLSLYIHRGYEVRPVDGSDGILLLVKPPPGSGPLLGIGGRLQLFPGDCTLPPPYPGLTNPNLLSSTANCDEVLRKLRFLAEHQPAELSSLSALGAALGGLAVTVMNQEAMARCRAARLEAEALEVRLQQRLQQQLLLVEAAPSEPALVEAAPSEPALVEAAPLEPALVEAAPLEPALVEAEAEAMEVVENEGEESEGGFGKLSEEDPGVFFSRPAAEAGSVTLTLTLTLTLTSTPDPNPNPDPIPYPNPNQEAAAAPVEAGSVTLTLP